MLRPSFGYLGEPDQSVGSTVAHKKPRCLIRTNCDFLALTVPPWKRLPPRTVPSPGRIKTGWNGGAADGGGVHRAWHLTPTGARPPPPPGKPTPPPKRYPLPPPRPHLATPP